MWLIAPYKTVSFCVTYVYRNLQQKKAVSVFIISLPIDDSLDLLLGVNNLLTNGGFK